MVPIYNYLSLSGYVGYTKFQLLRILRTHHPTGHEMAEYQPFDSEFWMPYPQHRGYLISSHGRVIGPSGKILRQNVSGRHYLAVAIRGKRKPVHQLVLETFVGPKPKGNVCRHGDKGPLCNRLDNLSYGTRSENNGMDRFRDGTNGKSLSAKQVNEIRSRAQSGESYASLSLDFRVSVGTVGLVVRGDLWPHDGLVDPECSDRRKWIDRPWLSKFTVDEVRSIRKRAASGESQKSISEEFSVNITTIARIVSRETWSHVE